MQKLVSLTLRRLAQFFLAGVLAILPVVVTVAVVVWVADFLRGFLGPDTFLGGGLRHLGLAFATDGMAAYVAGTVMVLVAVFVVGIFVEAGARTLLERLLDALLQRIPLIGSIYGTSKQLVSMLDKKDDAAMKGMKAVFCHFGGERGSGVLALLVSPERYRINGRDYLIVIVPTAPVPIGGGLLFVPVEIVQQTDLTVEGLMSIYVSMGVTTPQFLPPVEGETPVAEAALAQDHPAE